jgi:hypothetical protein
MPEEAAPSVQSTDFRALSAPAATACELPDPSMTASLPGQARRVAPRARSTPLFLLFAAFLV